MTAIDRSVLPVEYPVTSVVPALDVRDQDVPFPAIRPVSAPEGAPNVLLILIDDMGFGASSAFGGPCRMPTAERLADEGLRYSRFHTTALCAPTRTALLTGRNHHSCGMGALPEMGTSAPGYTGVRPRSTGTIARMLSCNGYATGAFGKMHQTPPLQVPETGPFDNWPTGDGFDRFYGFLGAETNQFSPNLIDGVTPIDPPRRPEEGYHLSEDLADQAIAWVASLDSLEPGRPWFCYLSFGACHAPLHVPVKWRARYRGEFADGWDVQRDRTLARQKELGVIPADARLAPWASGVPHWQELSGAEQRVAERQMEVYAAFAEHTDAQCGRLIAALDRLGQLDNTLVLYVLGDNGAEAIGPPQGAINEYIGINALPEDLERAVEQIDEIGGPTTYPQYPPGWAIAMNTPYQEAKSVASHFGGTRNGLIVRWTNGIASRGEVRHQWHHCIDVMPTVLDVIGLPEPVVVDGAPQRPIEGVSFAYSFDDPTAAERHTTQYFEILGNRGIYDQGWTAVAKHRTALQLHTPVPKLADDVWELYDTNSDWTQAQDIAAQYPDKLESLKQKFLIEAARFLVLPLDDRTVERRNPAIAGRRSVMDGRTSMTLRPTMPGLHELAAPDVKNTSFSLVSLIDVQEGGADGVIVAQGGRFGGWSLYVYDGLLCYCYNLAGIGHTYARGREPLAPGRRLVECRFAYDGGGLGKGGLAELFVDGKASGDCRIERTMGYSFPVNETLDIGIDRHTAVTDEYGDGAASAFTGIIAVVRIHIGDDALDPPDAESMRVALTLH